MPAYVFDYDVFYAYYTNASNYFVDNNYPRPTIWYYPFDVYLTPKHKTAPIAKDLPPLQSLIAQVRLT